MWKGNVSGGGGFIASPGNTASPSNRSPSKKQENRSGNDFPCTISQVEAISLNESSIKVGSLEASQFVIVAKVKDIETATTNKTYTVDDYTGQELMAKVWASTEDDDEDDGSSKPKGQIEIGQYVRITGQLKGLQGKRFLNALEITPLKSLNQLSVHMLEVIYARAVAESWQQTLPEHGFGNQSTMDTGMAGFHGNMMDNLDGMDNVQKSVHSVIQAVPGEHGCSIDHIFQTLSSTSKDSIRKALDFLSSEGHIYPTIDDDHYKAT